MGFLLAGNALLVLFLLLLLLRKVYGDDWEGLYEASVCVWVGVGGWVGGGGGGYKPGGAPLSAACVLGSWGLCPTDLLRMLGAL